MREAIRCSVKMKEGKRGPRFFLDDMRKENLTGQKAS
jgi:hypothetical protein